MNKIEITNNAQEHIASVLKKDSAKYFRITVLGGGCSGFQYKFDFEKSKNKDDILIEDKIINVVIDETSMELIQNSKIDYVHELIGSSFKITNPTSIFFLWLWDIFFDLMKISTWNVNSVNARIEHLVKFIKKDQSDFYLLQELKTVEEGFPKEIIEDDRIFTPI